MLVNRLQHSILWDQFRHLVHDQHDFSMAGGTGISAICFRHLLRDSIWTAFLWYELHLFCDLLHKRQDNLLHQAFLGAFPRRRPQGELDRKPVPS